MRQRQQQLWGQATRTWVLFDTTNDDTAALCVSQRPLRTVICTKYIEGMRLQRLRRAPNLKLERRVCFRELGALCTRGCVVSLQSVQQVKRFFKILGGFTLLAVGIVMLVTPGPGWLIILSGLALLAAEFVWAQRLLNRIKAGGQRLRQAVLPSSASKTATTK